MKNKSYSVSAFSLVEVTLALGVASFCLVAVLGLLPAGIQTNQAGIQQTTANGILSAVVSDMEPVRFPPGKGVVSKQFNHDFLNAPVYPILIYFSNDGSPSGTAGDGTAADTNTTFYASIDRVPTLVGAANGAASRTATLLDVKVAWPYTSGGNGKGNNSTSVSSGSVETVVALDIN